MDYINAKQDAIEQGGYPLGGDVPAVEDHVTILHEIDKLHKSMEVMRVDITEIKTSVGVKQAHIEDVLRRIERLESDIKSAVSEMNSIQKALAVQQTKMAMIGLIAGAIGSTFISVVLAAISRH